MTQQTNRIQKGKRHSLLGMWKVTPVLNTGTYSTIAYPTVGDRCLLQAVSSGLESGLPTGRFYLGGGSWECLLEIPLLLFLLDDVWMIRDQPSWVTMMGQPAMANDCP